MKADYELVPLYPKTIKSGRLVELVKLLQEQDRDERPCN